MISFGKFLCLIISFIVAFIVIATSTGIVYMNGFNPRENFYPVNVTQYQTYLNVSLPINITIIWYPNEPTEYIIYDRNTSDIPDSLVISDNSEPIPDNENENGITFEGCLNVCYSFVGYYNVNTKLLTFCDEASRTEEHNNKPVYKFCGYNDNELLIVFIIFCILSFLSIVLTPFAIIGYTSRYKKSSYDSIN